MVYFRRKDGLRFQTDLYGLRVLKTLDFLDLAG